MIRGVKSVKEIKFKGICVSYFVLAVINLLKLSFIIIY